MSGYTLKKQEIKKYTLEGISERLKDSNFHSLSGCKLLDQGYIIAQYANTGTMVVHHVIESFPSLESQPSRDSLKKSAPSRTTSLKNMNAQVGELKLSDLTVSNQDISKKEVVNDSPIICLETCFPYLISYHENATLQIYNVATQELRQIKNQAIVHKPIAMLCDKTRIVFIYSKDVVIWPIAITSDSQPTQLLTLDKPLHGAQQKYCKMKWPKLFLASKTDIQLWDASTPKLVFSSSVPNGTATLLHLYWVPEVHTAVGAISDSLLLWKLDSKHSEPKIISVPAFVSSVFANSKFIITGDVCGVITIRNINDGDRVGAALIKNKTSTDSPSRSRAVKRTSTRSTLTMSTEDVAFKINKVFFQTFLYVAHEDGKMTIWDLNHMEKPLKKLKAAGPVREFMVNNQHVYFSVQVENQVELVLFSFRTEGNGEVICLDDFKDKKLDRKASVIALGMGTDPTVTDKEVDDLICKAIHENSGIPREGFQKNRGKIKRKLGCFTGTDAVQWLQHVLKIDEKTAIQKAQSLLMNRDVFYSVSKKHTSFHNSDEIYYKFRVHELEESEVLNVCKRSADQVENPAELSVNLINTLNEAISCHFSEKPLKTNALFIKFALMTCKLQQVRLQSMNEKEKLVFLLNLHNLLIVHSQIVFSKKVLGKSYQVGNYDITLPQIVAALRGNVESIADPGLRSLLKIDNVPMIHFCLLSYNEQVSPFKAFTMKKLNENIEEVTREKLTESMIVSIETKEIWLPRLVTQYAGDFGNNGNEALEKIAKFMDAKFQQLVKDLNFRVHYQKKA